MRFMLIAAMSYSLVACQMTSPSHISALPIEITESSGHHNFLATDFNASMINDVTNDYQRYGDGPLMITVTYQAETKSSKMADAQAKAIAQKFRRAGIKDIVADSLPIIGDQAPRIMIDYTRLLAKGPRDCMNNVHDRRERIASDNDGRFDDSRYGCGVDQMIAAQVKRPKDLLGRDTLSPALADRAAGSQQDYHDGKPLPDLKAQNASETKL